MNKSYFKEHPKKQEDIGRRKVVKEEEAGSGSSTADIVNPGSEPDYQICLPPGWVSW
jgi:hypothetical protein